jgi:hypothetical protein
MAAAVEERHMYESAPRRIQAVKGVKDSANWPFEFAVVPIKNMLVDVYQRPLTSFVDKIEKEFDPALLGTVVLSQRGRAEYALVDGQTRAEGAKRVGLAALPAIVYKGLTVEQEAELFAKFQTERRRMHTVDLFNAQVHAGLEPQVHVARIARKMGFKMHEVASQGKDHIAAPMSLVWVYNSCTSGSRAAENPQLLETTLEVISEAWPSSPIEARSAQLIKGLGYYLHHYNDDEKPIDVGRLIDRLGRVMPSELVKRAVNLREGRGASASSPKYMAEAIDSQYNRMVR